MRRHITRLPYFTVRRRAAYTVRVLGVLLVALFYAGAQPAARHPTIDKNHFKKSSFDECYASDIYSNVENPQNAYYHYSYDKNGNGTMGPSTGTSARRCVPDFINVAYELPVTATNVCGANPIRPTRFCVQAEHQSHQMNRFCDFCSERVPDRRHPASMLTDFNTNGTWWQSETMFEGIQYPQTVNLTLNIGKAFEVAYVRLKFISPRPESFRILKKTRHDSEWTPWQYYSASCRSTYKMPEKAPLLPHNEAVAQCTREFSDISPLTGENIVFATLEGRPSAQNFDENELLQEWVTATEIRIVLDRLNTFGDEIYGDAEVLRSYYYAISDFAVGGHCKCNGHAARCVASTLDATTRVNTTYATEATRIVCDCQHNTAGVDCERCAPFYVDRPWRRASALDANECLPCQCNGLSQRCFFDAKLFETTGHGGHCIDCAGNTVGPHCESCAPGHWRRPGERYCTVCNCDTIGALSAQCHATTGACVCKPGVVGERCDRCAPGFHSLGEAGCKNCGCMPAGSVDNAPACAAYDGACVCKSHVEGRHCERCKPGYFRLAAENEFGCTPCFCYGHSSVCESAGGFYAHNLTSEFLQDAEGWTARSSARVESVQWAEIERAIAVSQLDANAVYFEAPTKFLGDQRLLYDQYIMFTLRVQQKHATLSNRDLIVVGHAATGQRYELTLSLAAQQNVAPPPGARPQTYAYRVHAGTSFEWRPQLREYDFISVLANVSAIRVRGTYSQNDVGFLSHFSVGSAVAGLSPELGIPQTAADWVESCRCPEGYEGQFCERCAFGYRRATPSGGPFTKCVRCSCNGHADECDSESGVCACRHNTDGVECERCARGFFGDAQQRHTPHTACQPCDCPDGGPCAVFADGVEIANFNLPANITVTDTVCTDCPEGHTGTRCDYCLDGYYGSPKNGVPCRRCECNGNVDANAIATCDGTTGECLRCVYNTVGAHCERCAHGFWGDALAVARVGESSDVTRCHPCDCYAPGSVQIIDINRSLYLSVERAELPRLECALADGQCACRANVVGRRCDQCAPGFFNITSGFGCQPCDCNALGTVDSGFACDALTGACDCKPGVIGLKCDQCAPQHYAFDAHGCASCACHPDGAESDACDIHNGQCLCRDNVEGRLCDRCAENHYDLADGCLACDDCYALIQARKNDLNASTDALRRMLDELSNVPVHIDDDAFRARIDATRDQLSALHARANQKFDGNAGETSWRFDALRGELRAVDALIRNTTRLFKTFDYANDFLENRIESWKIQKGELQRNLLEKIENLKLENEKISSQMATNTQENSRLSALATQASELSALQTQRVGSARELSAQIALLSHEALTHAHESVFGKTNKSTKKLADLEVCIREAQRAVNVTRKLSAQLHADVAQTLDSAARKLGDVAQLDVHKHNSAVDELNVRNSRLREDVKTLAAGVNESAAVHTPLLDAARAELNATRQRLVDVRARFENGKKIVARLKDASQRAQKSVHDSIEVYEKMKNALETLNELKNEDEMALERESADAAMRDAPRIKTMLAKVDAKLARIEDAAGAAAENANYARAIATKTRDDARAFATPLNKLAEESTSLRVAVESALARITELERDAERTERESHEKLETASRNRDKIADATRSAAHAEQIARQANKSAHANEALLRVVVRRLESLGSVDNAPADDAQLDELERVLTQLELEYADSNIDAIVEASRRRIADANSARRMLRGEMSVLRDELATLQRVRDALPTACFNKSTNSEHCAPQARRLSCSGALRERQITRTHFIDSDTVFGSKQGELVNKRKEISANKLTVLRSMMSDKNNNTSTLVTLAGVSIDTSRARGNAPVVSMCARKLRMTEYKEPTTKACNIYWHNVAYADMRDVVHGGALACVNRFPGMSEIARKAALTHAVRSMACLFPTEYDFYPRSWVLPAQLDEFRMHCASAQCTPAWRSLSAIFARRQSLASAQNAHNNGPAYYIVKPDDGAQGAGIYLIRSADELRDADILTHRQLVQEYVSTPMLLADGLKFDLRVYAVLRALNPLSIYIAREGMARFCTARYSPPTAANLENSYAHLTNYSLNKASDAYVHSKSLKDQVQGSKRLLSTVFHQMEARGVNTRQLWRDIKRIVARTVLAMVPELMLHYEHYFANAEAPQCFQILGFDIIVRADGTPMLLEVNAAPSLSVEHNNNDAPPVASGVTPASASPISVVSPPVRSIVDEVIKVPLVYDCLLLVSNRLDCAIMRDDSNIFKPIDIPSDTKPQPQFSQHNSRTLGRNAVKISEDDLGVLRRRRKSHLSAIFPGARNDARRLLVLDRAVYLFMQFVSVRHTVHASQHAMRAFLRKCNLNEFLQGQDFLELFDRVHFRHTGRPADPNSGLPFHGFVEVLLHLSRLKFPDCDDNLAAFLRLLAHCDATLLRYGVRSARLRHVELPATTVVAGESQSSTEIYLLPNRLKPQYLHQKFLYDNSEDYGAPTEFHRIRESYTITVRAGTAKIPLKYLSQCGTCFGLPPSNQDVPFRNFLSRIVPIDPFQNDSNYPVPNCLVANLFVSKLPVPRCSQSQNVPF